MVVFPDPKSPFNKTSSDLKIFLLNLREKFSTSNKLNDLSWTKLIIYEKYLNNSSDMFVFSQEKNPSLVGFLPKWPYAEVGW